MRKILFFLYSLPLRFPCSSGLIILFLAAIAFLWLMLLGISNSPPPMSSDPMGNGTGYLPLLVSLTAKLLLMFGQLLIIATFLIDLSILLNLRRKNIGYEGYLLLAHLFWIFFLLGLYPLFAMRQFLLT